MIGQLGQSLDGRIAAPNGQSHYINGDEALEHLHRLRALVDAVVVGASTIALDNPSLTVRRVEGLNPARVIIDPKRRVDMGSKVFTQATAPTLIIGPQHKDDPPETDCIEPGNAGTIEPSWIADQLAERGLKRLLIEGGATTVSQFIASGNLDRLHILTGPIIIGSGSAGINLPAIDHLKDAVRPETKVFPFAGGDVLFDCDLRKSGTE
ncbi:MAG: RibD family protein [Hyphomicrobiaceae bacterium]